MSTECSRLERALRLHRLRCQHAGYDVPQRAVRARCWAHGSRSPYIYLTLYPENSDEILFSVSRAHFENVYGATTLPTCDMVARILLEEIDEV